VRALGVEQRSCKASAGCTASDMPEAAEEGSGVKRSSSTEGSKAEIGYGNGPAYWNKRYKSDPAPFEWLEGFADLRDIISQASKDTMECQILHTGCGNSLLPEEMYDAGYRNITNIDNSAVVIKQMAERNVKRPDMKWLTMDATRMLFKNCTFDVVIDKSVIDAMACGDHAPLVIGSYLNEVQRVLKPGGTFVCVTYGAPDSRLSHFSQRHLELSIRHFALPLKDSSANAHWVYILERPAVIGRAPSLWPEVKKELTF